MNLCVHYFDHSSRDYGLMATTYQSSFTQFAFSPFKMGLLGYCTSDISI